MLRTSAKKSTISVMFEMKLMLSTKQQKLHINMFSIFILWYFTSEYFTKHSLPIKKTSLGHLITPLLPCLVRAPRKCCFSPCDAEILPLIGHLPSNNVALHFLRGPLPCFLLVALRCLVAHDELSWSKIIMKWFDLKK